MQILIVEDNRDIAANMAEFLEAKGHAADVASDGAKGLSQALLKRYDAMVVDRQMPGMDGIALCRELRRDDRTTPVLILSACGTRGDWVEAFAAGANGYLVKPVALSEVEEKLRWLCEQWGGVGSANG